MRMLSLYAVLSTINHAYKDEPSPVSTGVLMGHMCATMDY